MKETERRYISERIASLSSAVSVQTEQSDEWLAGLPLRSERLFSEDEPSGALPAAEGLMVM